MAKIDPLNLYLNINDDGIYGINTNGLYLIESDSDV